MQKKDSMQGIGIVGHSGCKLTIQDDIIYKTTKDNAYSKRLKKQCEKQKDFYNFFQNNEIFVVPEVLGEYWNISDIRRGGGEYRI